MEAVTDFIFLGSKISDYSHEMKRSLLLGRISMTNLNSVLKTKHDTLPKNVFTVNIVSPLPSGHVWM